MKQTNPIWLKLKSLAGDSLWSILALVLMNVVSQFAVYPIYSQKLGSEAYGNVLYMLSIVNIISVSLGVGCNYARMAESAHRETKNGDYNLFFIGMSLAGSLFILGFQWSGFFALSPAELLLFIALMWATGLRYYCDVEFRLNLNYRGYFIYYAFISIGYLLGISLFFLTGLWPLALLMGEIFGLVYVYFCGKTLKRHPGECSIMLRANLRAMLVLFISNLLPNIIFFADRILLKAMVSGTAVTIYYLASLFGKTMSLITTPLNSVIIGHLARYKGKLTPKLMAGMALGGIFAAPVVTVAVTLASHLLIRILYPGDYALTAPFFFIANFSQVLYFISNIFTVILLRFCKQRYQMDINVSFTITFFALAIPLTLAKGLWGFSWAMLIANVVRFMIALGLGFYHTLNLNKGEN